MATSRFEGFSPTAFRFLRQLAANNNKAWFDKNREVYHQELLEPMRALVVEVGPLLRILNPELETEPKVGRTISRISNDMRFHKNRPPYRPFIYAGFPRQGKKWSNDALLFVSVFAHGVSVGFYAGGHTRIGNSPLSDAARLNPRLFQRYLKERAVTERYTQLLQDETEPPKTAALPAVAREWASLEAYSLGCYFRHTDRRLRRRSFLDLGQEALIDLYPLWMFATSDEPAAAYAIYNENAGALSAPLTKAISGG